MDAEALKHVLNQLQASNQAFIASMVKENWDFLEKTIRENKVAGERQMAIPNFRPFNKSNDRRSTYILQLEQHFLAICVTEEPMRCACILSWVGAENLELLQTFFDGKVKEKTFKEITTALNDHFIEKQHMLAACFKLYRTTLRMDQTYSDWVAELRGRSKDFMFTCCKAGCSESYVDSKIRDMIVMHTRYKKVRTAALQKTNPTLEEVLQIASIYESTVRTCPAMKELGCADSKWQKSNISRGSPEKALKSCPGCGTSHWRNDCIYFKRKTKCNSCSRPGHISSVCKSTEKRKTSKCKQVNVVNDVSQPTFENISGINVVNTTSDIDEKIEVKLHVNGKSLSFQVDTGASCSLVGMLGKPKCVRTVKY
ncbi:PREDICTED: uncharacterized protein LOC108360272 [Rhagoletis zephyria]|uniref:uncharacterized protein LOC108360272 n=1 Tax=Rhagoletis zephyria TaxID=28612 RepID=UPI0008114252|nr:PREDICTED: uncharacterized protein LOC108360272 [Rhagoletis zephyria]